MKMDDSLGRKMRLPLNDAAFSKRSEFSDYWAGFILADGSIIRRGRLPPSIAIDIGDIDLDHILAFRQFMSSGHRVCRSRGSARISFTSKAVASDLSSNYGIGHEKSSDDGTIHPNVANSRHFWRGVIDGDGCIGHYERPYAQYPGTKPWVETSLVLVGPLYVVEAFRRFCLNFIETKAAVRPDGSIYRFSISGNKAKRIIMELYRESNVHLHRKKALADITFGV